MRLVVSILFTVSLLGAFGQVYAQSDSGEGASDREMTLQERMEHLGVIVPEQIKRQFEALNMQEPPILLDPEAYFDWREMGGVTPVKDQASCGSCWDFAATGAFESAILIADSVEWDLSEQQVLDCNGGGSSCAGGWMGDAYDLYRNYGAIEEPCYPYRASDRYRCEQDSCVVMVALDSYMEVQDDVDAIKNALLFGPVSSCFMVYNDFQWDCYDHPYEGEINHAIVIVGWDDEMCDGQGGWIVKNSWGPAWGDEGYFYIPYGSCGIGNYTQQPIYESRLPELAYRPESITFNMQTGGEAEETMRLSNTGIGNLYYRVRELPPDFQDSFGYVWFDSDSPLGPEYNWVDITGTGETIEFPGNADNSNSGPLDLGFDFSFYGNTFSSINVCSNGWASFSDSTSTNYYYLPIPYAGQPNNLLAAFWTDLNPALGGNVYFYTDNADTAIISWVDVYDSWGEGIFTFQIQLIAPDMVNFQYASMGPEGRIDRATIGIENGDGTIGLQVSRQEIFTYGGKSVQFTLGNPPGEFDWLSVNHDHDSIPPSDSLNITVTCAAGDHTAGTYWGYVDLYTNDPQCVHAEIPVAMNIGMTAVDDSGPIAADYSIGQNYPNPFNASTSIQYSLPEASHVKVDIFDILGRKVATLVDEAQPAGRHQVVWQSNDQPSGTYFYRIQAGEHFDTRKMVLLK